jgi:hypothetical protein
MDENGKSELSRIAAEMGRCGGRVRSARKAAAVRENGKKGGRPALPTVSARASKLLHGLASNLLEGSAAFRGRAGERLSIASKIVKEKGYGELERALARECAFWGEDAVPVCSALKDACVRSHPFAVFKVVKSEWERSFGDECGRDALARERMDSPLGLV